MLEIIKLGIVKVLMATLALFGVNVPVNAPVEQPVVQVLGADSTKTAGLQTYYLSGSGVTSSASSITITSFTIPQNGVKILDADLSDTFYLTLEPGNRTRQEFASCTTDTQNSDGSATFSGCTRGLSPLSPYTASTTLQFAHAGGSSLIFSNPPQLYDNAVFKNNDETITGTYTFSSTSRPTYDGNATASGNELVSFRQLNDTAISGGATSTESALGFVQLANQTQLGGGTASSSAGAPLVAPSKFFGNKYNATTTGVAVMTDSTGKIDNDFIATSTNDIYNFGGMITITASTTLSATTTLQADTAHKLSINGLPRTYPLTRGASSTIEVDDGSGNKVDYLQDLHLITKQNFTGVATGTVSFTSTSNRLKVLIYDGGSFGGVNNLRNFTFNASTTGYSYQNYVDYNPYGSVRNASLDAGTLNNFSVATTSLAYITMDIQNDSALTKRARWEGSYNLETSIPDIVSGTTIWNDKTSQLTSIDFHAYRWGNAVGTWTDLRVEVYGNNP